MLNWQVANNIVILYSPAKREKYCRGMLCLRNPLIAICVQCMAPEARDWLTHTVHAQARTANRCAEGQV